MYCGVYKQVKKTRVFTVSSAPRNAGADLGNPSQHGLVVSILIPGSIEKLTRTENTMTAILHVCFEIEKGAGCFCNTNNLI